MGAPVDGPDLTDEDLVALLTDDGQATGMAAIELDLAEAELDARMLRDALRTPDLSHVEYWAEEVADYDIPRLAFYVRELLALVRAVKAGAGDAELAVLLDEFLDDLVVRAEAAIEEGSDVDDEDV